MKLRHPLFLVRDDTDVDAAFVAVASFLSADCHPLILVQPAAARNWRVNYILDTWDCGDEALDSVRQKSQRLVQAFASRGIASEVETLRHDEPWRIRGIASRHGADILVTSRFPKARPNKQHTALAEADLARSLSIPVCFVGTAGVRERPIVGMLDLTKNFEVTPLNNHSVVETTFAMAVQDDAISQVVFVTYCPSADTPVFQRNPSGVRREIPGIHEITGKSLLEGDEKRKRFSRLCDSVELHISGGSESELRQELLEIDPIVFVMGSPVRSALARCFNPGMTPLLLGTDRTVLMTHHALEDGESADEMLPKPQQRDMSDGVGRKTDTTSLKI